MSNINKVKIKIEGMHCSSCAMDIDGELEDTDGISESKTSYVKQQTEVIFDSNIIDLKKIIKIVNDIGYKAAVL